MTIDEKDSEELIKQLSVEAYMAGFQASIVIMLQSILSPEKVKQLALKEYEEIRGTKCQQSIS